MGVVWTNVRIMTTNRGATCPTLNIGISILPDPQVGATSGSYGPAFSVLGFSASAAAGHGVQLALTTDR